MRGLWKCRSFKKRSTWSVTLSFQTSDTVTGYFFYTIQIFWYPTYRKKKLILSFFTYNPMDYELPICKPISIWIDMRLTDSYEANELTIFSSLKKRDKYSQNCVGNRKQLCWQITLKISDHWQPHDHQINNWNPKLPLNSQATSPVDMNHRNGNMHKKQNNHVNQIHMFRTKHTKQPRSHLTWKTWTVRKDDYWNQHQTFLPHSGMLKW